MDSALAHVVPVPALGLIIFLVLALASMFFVPRQRAREFTMLTVGRVLAIAAAASLATTGIELAFETAVPLRHLIVMLPTAALLYLLGITVVTDFSIHKIPTESAWLPAVIGVAAMGVGMAAGLGNGLTVDRLFVLIVLGVLPVTAFLSMLLSGGGAADYRVAMSGFLATWWWVSPMSLMFGLLAFVALTAIGRFRFSKRLPNGKRMTPAGPAYVSLFAVMAASSIVLMHV